MKNGNVVLKSGIWYMVSNFLTRGIVFLTTPLFTRMLTKEEFGAFSNFSSWLNILSIIITLNVEASLISARYDYKDRVDNYVFSALGLSTASAAVWLVICNIFMGPVSAFLEMDPFYINLMLVYMFFLPALHLYQTQELYFYRYKNSTALSLITTMSSALIAVVLVLTLTNKLGGRIYGQIIPTVVIGGMLYLLIARRGIAGGQKMDFGVWKYALKVCTPYIPHLLSLTLLSSIDRIMITKMLGESETAMYSVAASVAMIVSLFLSAFNGAFSPWMAERLSKGEFKDIRKISKGYIGLFMCFAVGLMLLAPEVLLIMGGEAYMGARDLMIPVALGCVCQFLYTLFVNVEQYCKKTVGMAFASISATVLKYLLNLWLIPQFGYISAAYTTLIGYIWLLAVHMLLVRRMEQHTSFSYPFVIGALLAIGGVAVCVGFLYLWTWVRYAVVLAYVVLLLVLAWKYRSIILGVLRKKTT